MRWGITKRRAAGIVASLLVTQSAAAMGDMLARNDEEAFRSSYGDEEMVTIATGVRQDRSKAPAVASVITAEDIKEIGATDLDQVLETVPGLHVAHDPAGYNPIYTFRGIYASSNPQVLMLINGIPITNLFHGDRGQVWGGMPVESIARIEIIRGPGSAVYGADAFAGVINIITKTSRDIPGTEVGARVGSFSTRDAWVLHGGAIGRYAVAFMVEYHETDGQKGIIDQDGQSLLDSAFSSTASLAPGPVSLSRRNLDVRLDVSREKWRIRAGLQKRSNFGNGAGVAQALDPSNRLASERWNADVTYHDADFTRNWDVSATLSYFQTSQEVENNLVLFPPGTVLPIGSDGNINKVSPVGLVTFTDGLIGNPENYERHIRFNVSAFYSGFDDHLIRIGAGMHYGDLYKVNESKNFGPGVIDGSTTPIDGTLTNVSGTSNVFLLPGIRRDYYVFAQDSWSLRKKWELTYGLRYDDYSDFGGTANPRVALVWSATQRFTTKWLYGRAFRAPSFAQMRNINNPVALGNPSLKPETIETLEWAFNYRPVDTVNLGLNLYSYRWDDIIIFMPDPSGTTSTAQNAGEQTGSGVELEADWQPSRDFRVVGNYSYQDSTDRTTGHAAGYAPQQQFYIRAVWNFLPEWQVVPQFNYVMGRKRAAGDNRPGIADYRTVDLTLRRKTLLDDWEVALIVRNLLDADARDPSPAGNPVAAIPNDLPLPGRTVLGEIRYKF